MHSFCESRHLGNSLSGLCGQNTLFSTEYAAGGGQKKNTEQWGRMHHKTAPSSSAFLLLLQTSDFYQRFYLNKGVRIAKMHLAALFYVPKSQPITTTGQAKGRSVISLVHNSTIRTIRQPP